MAFTEFAKDMAIIAKLDDEPNDVGGLTAAELKTKFDEAGESLKKYINESLLPELAAATAAAALGAVMDGKAVSVQDALNLIRQSTIQSGNVPTGGVAKDYLRKKSDGLYDLEWAQLPEQFTRFAFVQADWTEGEDGVYMMTIPQSIHKRKNADFGCAVRHKVNGVLKNNTWAVLGTQSAFDEATNEIVLTATDPYEGTVLFFDEGLD